MSVALEQDPAISLFRPFRLGCLDLANRIVMAPMTRSMAKGGVPTAAMAEYYARRAAHGVGLVMTEAVGIDRPGSVNEPDVPVLHGVDALEGWRMVVDAVHDASGRIMPQLWHVGQKRSRATPEWTPGGGYESPSGLSLTGERVGRPMAEAAISETVAAFARAAAVAEEIGFDGVEVHGGHGYLLDQFLHSHLNRRHDRYGGSTLADRSRFGAEVIAATRAVVGPGFPVVLRLSQWRPDDFAARHACTPDELRDWLRPFVDAGVDALDMSQQRFDDVAFPEFDPDLSLAGWAKRLTGLPTIAVGSVGLSATTHDSFAGRIARVAPLDDLLARLDRGEFDLVAVGRALLQDPAWLEKVANGRRGELRDFVPASLETLG